MGLYFIAEAGVNHNGDLGCALDMIDVAAEAGADAVKFQTAIPEEVISETAPKARYQKATTDPGESQLDMIRALHFRDNRVEAHQALLDRARERKIDFISTPFDIPSVDFLARQLNLPRIKVASGEVTNGPLLLAIAQTGRQIILSTGMSTTEEVEIALGVLAFGLLGREGLPSLEDFEKSYASSEGKSILAAHVAILHCVTAYPALAAQTNLRAMDTLRAAFELPVGLSDHTQGIVVAIAAAARGAVIIEKHFTLDRSLPGPDHAASLEPDELVGLIQNIREVESALGDGVKAPQPCELENLTVARRSLIARQKIQADDSFTEENLTAKRPGSGLSPLRYWEFLGKPARRSYEKDDLIE